MDASTTIDTMPILDATETPVIETPVIDTSPAIDNTIINNQDVLLPMEQSFFTTSFNSSSTPIDTILNDYFSIFPVSYFLLIVSIGICSVLIYTLYSYLEQ